MTKLDVYTITRIPLILLNLLFSKIFNLIYNIKFDYMHLSAKIDIGMSYGIPFKIKENLKKVNLNYITNKKVKRTLLFGKWNTYSVRTKELKQNDIDSNREIIYITKDILKKDDLIYCGRISDYRLNKAYVSNGKFKRFLDKRNILESDFYKLESQIYVIVALKTKSHDILKEQRELNYKKKIIKDYNKKVNLLIKREEVFAKYKVLGDWSNMPLFFKCIKENRIDLVKKILAFATDNEKQQLMDYIYMEDEYPYKEINAISLAKTSEMEKLLDLYKN